MVLMQSKLLPISIGPLPEVRAGEQLPTKLLPLLTIEGSSERIRRRGSLSSIFANVRTRLHRDKSVSPNSSSDDSHAMSVGRRSRSLRSSATCSGTDSTGYDIPHCSLSAKPPQLEALPESPPPTLKGSTFAEDFLKAADDIKTKYDSFTTTQPCSFNPNFSKTVPIRRKTIKQRLASGSKSLFRSKAQRRGRCQRSDQRSSETTEPEDIPNAKKIISKSPNWEPVQSRKERSEDGTSRRQALVETSHGCASGEQETSSGTRVFSNGSEKRLSQQQCAIYLAATAQEELKAAEDMKRRQAKLESLKKWPLEPTSAEIPNTAESSTGESPFLVEPQVPNAEDQGQTSMSTLKGCDVSTYKAQIEGFREAVKSTLVVEMEVPLSEHSVRSLSTIELDPLKVDEPEYQGSPRRSRPQRSHMTEEAMEETVYDIQEPTSTFTYIPVATTASSDAGEDYNKQRAQIEAAISSRRAAANPLASPRAADFDGETVSGNHAAARDSSSNFSATSISVDLDGD